jgi:hypothetical protein
MTEQVKNEAAGGPVYRRGAGQTRISAKHQVTIPISEFLDADIVLTGDVTAPYCTVCA